MLSKQKSNILARPFAPLSRLLPYAKALVHHGRIGTASQAFAAATPQLITPFAHDQFDNAARVERLGADFKLTAPELLRICRPRSSVCSKMSRFNRSVLLSGRKSIRVRCRAEKQRPRSRELQLGQSLRSALTHPGNGSPGLRSAWTNLPLHRYSFRGDVHGFGNDCGSVQPIGAAGYQPDPDQITMCAGHCD